LVSGDKMTDDDILEAVNKSVEDLSSFEFNESVNNNEEIAEKPSMTNLLSSFETIQAAMITTVNISQESFDSFYKLKEMILSSCLT
jgi:hypothetical protein